MTVHKKTGPLDYPYMDNLNADIRLIGFPAVLNPFVQNTSSSRLDMYRSHVGQAVVIDGCEFPYIWTGKEMDTGRYELNGTSRDQDAQIITTIPKYPVLPGGDQISENPTRTVIYRGEDNCIHYLNLDQYFMGADGFGYRNVMENEHLLFQDSFLPKEEELCHSPAKQGNKYCLGVNANVAYMTVTDTIEDAMVISRSLAEKMTSTEVSKMTIVVRPNEHPINHYGDAMDYKFLPDIGEYVGDDGVLCSFRPVDMGTFAADMQPENMREVQTLHDRIIKAPPGAKIVDIDFYVTKKRDQIPWSVYGQVEKYNEAIKQYWERIIEVHEQYKGKLGMSPGFSTLVARAISHTCAHGGRVKGISSRNVKFINRTEQPVDFLQIEVTYACKRKVERGFKISDKRVDSRQHMSA